MRKGAGGPGDPPPIPGKFSLHGASHGRPGRALPWGRETNKNAKLRTGIPSGADPDSGRISPLILEAACCLAWGFEGSDVQELS